MYGGSSGIRFWDDALSASEVAALDILPSPETVPEPTSLLSLIGLGTLGLASRLKKQK